MASTSTNKQPMMLDRPASTSTLVRTLTGQTFATSLLPTSIGNVTKVFDVDQALTDTQISGAYIDEIFIRYTKDVNQFIDAVTPTTATYARTLTATELDRLLGIDLSNIHPEHLHRIHLSMNLYHLYLHI